MAGAYESRRAARSIQLYRMAFTKYPRSHWKLTYYAGGQLNRNKKQPELLKNEGKKQTMYIHVVYNL